MKSIARQVLILFLLVLSGRIESNLIGTSMTNHQNSSITNKLETDENQNIQSWTPLQMGRTGCKRNITIGMAIERFLNSQIGRLDSLKSGLLDIRDAFDQIEDQLEDLLYGGRTDLLDWLL